jgi:hypothetical protein
MVSMKIQRLFSALPGDNFSIAVEPDIDIYCNTGNENKWLKYKSVILGEKPVTTKSIFLDNSKGNLEDTITTQTKIVEFEYV